MVTSRIRKQVYELTAEDLIRYPVWEFALDEEGEEGQDEATVRPLDHAEPVDPAGAMVIVRARLTLADGTRIPGYLTPQPPGVASLGTIQPQAITATGQVSFWCGIATPEPTYIAGSYQRLGKSRSEDVFPLDFVSDVAVLGGPIAGRIPGFLSLVDIQGDQTKVTV
jgi:hypothetical protein